MRRCELRKALFLMTHLGSGYKHLVDALGKNPRIDSYETKMSYDHPEKVLALTKNIHKQDNASSIYMDVLLYNHSFHRSLCKGNQFIFFIRKPEGALHDILSGKSEYTYTTAVRYYCYRLRGIYEYICRVPNPLVLTSGSKFSYLDQSHSVEVVDTGNVESKEASDCFERYFDFLSRS